MSAGRVHDRPLLLARAALAGGAAAARRAAGRLRETLDAHPVAARWVLAGPVALFASLATMAAMPLWLPAGAAGVNEIVLPILLTPLLWAVPFFYACLEPNLMRCAVLLLAPALLQGLLVAATLVMS